MEEKRQELEKQLKRQRISSTIWIAQRLISKISKKAYQNIFDLIAWKEL